MTRALCEDLSFHGATQLYSFPCLLCRAHVLLYERRSVKKKKTLANEVSSFDSWELRSCSSTSNWSSFRLTAHNSRSLSCRTVISELQCEHRRRTDTFKVCVMRRLPEVYSGEQVVVYMHVHTPTKMNFHNYPSIFMEYIQSQIMNKWETSWISCWLEFFFFSFYICCNDCGSGWPTDWLARLCWSLAFLINLHQSVPLLTSWCKQIVCRHIISIHWGEFHMCI